MSDTQAAEPEAPETESSSTGHGLTSNADSGPSPEALQDSQPSPETSDKYDSPFAIYGEEGAIEDRLKAMGDGTDALQRFLSKYKSPSEASKGLEHLNYMASNKGLQPLPPDASEADRQRHDQILKSVLNVPDSPEGYGIEKPEEMTDEQWEAVGIDEYLKVAQQHNVSPEAMKALWEVDQSRSEAIKAAAEQSAEKALEAEHQSLVQEYGDKVPSLYKKANQVADSFGLPREAIRDAATVKFLNKIAEAMSEDRLTSTNDSLLDSARTYDERIAAITDDPSNQFYRLYHSENPADQRKAADEMTRLINLKLKAQKGQA